MKQSSFNLAELTGRRVLILSDQKPGHLNQSIAFARYLQCQYDIVQVSFRNRLIKGLSYLFDYIGLYCSFLYTCNPLLEEYGAIVSAGSSTYYANKVTARSYGCPAIAIMMPKGYRLDFDLVVAQEHDNPPEKRNILSVPVNLSYSDPRELVSPELGSRYVSLIIGGDSDHFQLDTEFLKKQVATIFHHFPKHKLWLTTSRRTSTEVEDMLAGFAFDYAVFYSREPANPIPDFLQHSEYVFLTADSSSMISEAVSSGRSCIEILLPQRDFHFQGKIGRFLKKLAKSGYLHIFDGSCGTSNRKYRLEEALFTELDQQPEQ